MYVLYLFFVSSSTAFNATINVCIHTQFYVVACGHEFSVCEKNFHRNFINNMQARTRYPHTFLKYTINMISLALLLAWFAIEFAKHVLIMRDVLRVHYTASKVSIKR